MTRGNIVLWLVWQGKPVGLKIDTMMTITIPSLIDTNQPLLADFNNKLAYKFSNAELLIQALIHRSFAFEQGRGVIQDNEVLEFLGDAVLDLVVGFLLMSRYPEMKEGQLTKLRASLVNEANLAEMARRIDLGCYLFLGKGEDASGGRNKPSLLSGAFEAVVGAVFMDGGYDAAFALIKELFADDIAPEKVELLSTDYKTRLQEFCQERFNEAPLYVLEQEEGPDHDKIFSVTVRFRDQVLAAGQARNKKEAEQKAAATAFKNFISTDL